MKKLVNDFLDRYFHDEESIILMLLLTIGLGVLLFGCSGAADYGNHYRLPHAGPSRDSAAPGPLIEDSLYPRLYCVYWRIPVDVAVSSSICLESAAAIDERVTQPN